MTDIRLFGVLGPLLILVGLVLLLARGMPRRLEAWVGLVLIIAGGALQAYVLQGYVGAKAPVPDRDFVLGQRSLEPLVQHVCAETKVFNRQPTCYKDQWNQPVKELAARTMGRDAAAIGRDTEVEMPVESVVTYPDGTIRLLFEGCRAHACTKAHAYFLVNPEGTTMDILWGSDHGVKAFGPNAASLTQRKVYERLEEIRCRTMYPRLNPCRQP